MPAGKDCETHASRASKSNSHAAKLAEPIELHLSNHCDEQVREEDQHPRPGVEAREDALHAVRMRDVADRVGSECADSAEWNHHGPDDHAPWAERAK